MTARESHYKETLFKTKEQPVATTKQEEREVLYADATGTYKLVDSGAIKTGPPCRRCAFAWRVSPLLNGKLLCGMMSNNHFVKVSD